MLGKHVMTPKRSISVYDQTCVMELLTQSVNETATMLRSQKVV